MSRHEHLQSEFNRLGPWVTKFTIDGIDYGGKFDAMNDSRLDWFKKHGMNSGSVLELGSLEGGHSFKIAQNPKVAKVVCIEGRESNITKARFVAPILGAANVEFIHADLETIDLLTTVFSAGPFDSVLCCGVLYHLREPWRLITQIADTSYKLYIWTHYVEEKDANSCIDGYRGRWFREYGLKDPCSGLSAQSFRLTLDSLHTALTRNDFTVKAGEKMDNSSVLIFAEYLGSGLHPHDENWRGAS